MRIEIFHIRTLIALALLMYVASATDELCNLPWLSTDKSKIQVGCSRRCGRGQYAYSGKSECILISNEGLDYMQLGLRYTCPLGVCLSEICEPSGLQVQCWRTSLNDLYNRN
ncbi:hypothetical protein MTO96_030916 [Rhipicephalus appendiculatus]